MTIIRRLYPLGDQGFTALYNFLFVIISSVLLDSKNFIIINTVFLCIMFAINLQNALVLQPFMKESVNNKIKKASISYSIKYLVRLNLIFILFIGAYFIFTKINFMTFLLTIVWLFLLTFSEYIRRIVMVLNKWNYGFYFGLVNNLFSWIVILVVKPTTAIAYLNLIIICLFIMLIPYLFVVLKLVKLNIISDILLVNIYKKGGLILCGSAIAYWFITGGYLLLITHFIPLDQSSDLRKIQNMFNGIMLILTALDNFLLVGSGYIEDKKIKIMHLLLIVSNIVYGVFVYIAINIIYPGNVSLLKLLPMWICFYLILSIGKLWISILKSIYITKAIFLSQFYATIVFILLLSLIKVFAINLNSYLITFIWIPSSLVILIVCLVEKNKVFRKILSEVKS